MHRRHHGGRERSKVAKHAKIGRAAFACFEQLECRQLLSTVTTDKPDYAFGETALITGTEFAPSEQVQLVVQNAPGSGSNTDPQNQPFVVQADDLGSIATNWVVDDPDAIGATYIVTATGLSSGDVATATFTDSSSITAATVNSGASVTVKGGTSISIGVTEKNTAGTNWQSTGYLISTTPPGTYTVVDTPDHNGNGTFSESFSANAPAAEGTYNLYLIAYRGAGGTSPDGTLTLAGAITVDNTAPVISAQTTSPNPFSPNGDAVKDTSAISYSLSEASNVTIKIFNSSNTLVRTLITSAARASGANSDSWDGKNDSNATVPDGMYTFKIDATDAAGNVATTQTGTVTVDDSAPAVGISTATTTVNNANKAALSASGTAEIGAGISVVVTDGTHTSAPVTTTADGSGNWSVSGLNATTLNDGSISYRATATDSAGNSATAILAAIKDVVGPTVTINQDPLQADPSNSATINFKVVFNESVSDFATGEVTLGGTAGATTAIVSGSGTTYNVAVSGMTQSGTVIASLGAGVAHDAAGNASTASTSTDNQVTYDNVAPTVTNVTSSTANGAYTVGSPSISIQVTFSEIVNVTGTPQLALNSGGTANYSSGTGTATLTFNYVIGSGENTADLDYASTSALTPNGGSIKDAAGNDTTYALPAVGGAGSLGFNKNIVIDTTAPTVSNVTSITADGSYKAGQTITITVGFSEFVLVTATPTLALNSGGSASYSSGSNSNTLTFTYIVGAGQNTGDLDYSSVNALVGTIKDAAGNNANETLASPGTAGSLGFNKNIVFDTTAPAV
jgi:hypothetical protein